MYRFVDSTPQGSGSYTSLSIQTVFNGINLDEILTDENGSFVTLSVAGRSNSIYRVNTVAIPGMDGLYEQANTTMEHRQPLVTFKIKDRTNEGFRERVNYLNLLLEGSKRDLRFTDEDYYYYATVEAIELPEEDSNDVVGTIRFLCTDPYKYSDEKLYTFPSDDVIVENEGNSTAKPVFEMEVLEPVTFAMVQNMNEEYMMIGQPADDEVEVVSTKQSVLYENGSTLDTWRPASIDMVDRVINSVEGTMGTDGAGIRANPYGPGDRGLRGAAITKELSEGIQDFELETTFDIISRREEENWRMVIYLHDENLNNIGHIGMKDNSRNYKRRRPLGRIGSWHTYDPAPEGHYLLGDSSYTIDNARDTTLMYLRMRRVGKQFSFYIGEWQNFRHRTTWDERYFDVNEQWQGRVKYVTLFIGSYVGRPIPSRLRMNNVELFELGSVTEDQTPYIAYPGDIITFDHTNDSILINGESRTDLKDFGGRYFDLMKGDNVLIVRPENAFNSSVRFSNRFK